MFSGVAVPRLWLGLSWLDLLCYFEFSQIWSLFLFWAFSGKWYYLCTWNPFTFSAAHGGTAQSQHCFKMTSSKSQDTRPWRYLVNSSWLSRRCSSRHFPAAGQEMVFSNGDLTLRYRCPSRYCVSDSQTKASSKNKIPSWKSFKQEVSQLMKTHAKFCFFFLSNVCLKIIRIQNMFT